RTGAVPAVGVKHLAVENAEEVGIIGPGVMSRTILAYSITLRPSVKRVKIKGRTPGSTERTATYLRETHPGIVFTVVETEQEAIENSYILIAGTSTSQDGPKGFPYINQDWLKPGALVLAPAAARFDYDFITSGGDRLVVDYKGLYAKWFNE